MLTSLPGRDQSPEGWVSETFAALSRMPVDGPEPVVWPYLPYYSGNPFQAVLHSGFAEQGLVAVPTFRAGDLRHATRNWPADVPLVVHLHWLNQVLAKARTTAEADQAADRHAELLDLMKARGARLVWTVHNVLSHDTRFEAQEVRVRQDVIDRVDLVHVMSPRTEELVSPWYTLPAGRIYHCDHPGYQGVYPDWVSRADARRRLRIPDGARVLLLTGALKPYKGLLDLFEAVAAVAAERPGSIVLVVAGKPDDAPETAEFLARAARHPAVRLLPGAVPDNDVQVLMRAADVVALPYRRSLNSGVLALALSFGRPVLLPAGSGSAPLVRRPGGTAGVVYSGGGSGTGGFGSQGSGGFGSGDGAEVAALTEAVRACLTLDLAAAGRAAAEAGAAIDRAVVARRFATDLRAWADTGHLPPVASGRVSTSDITSTTTEFTAPAAGHAPAGLIGSGTTNGQSAGTTNDRNAGTTPVEAR